MPCPPPPRRRASLWTALAGRAVFLNAAFTVTAAFATTPADLEFFEKKIRPLLIERCYECHAAEHKIKAGLRLDTPEGWLTGGDSGPALIPGKPDASRLIRAIRYNDIEIEAMPPKSALAPAEVALLEDWVRRGAPAPATAPTPAAASASSAHTPTPARRSGLTLEEGKQFWAFLPPALVAPPALTRHASWPRNDIDRFIAAAWEQKSGNTPAAPFAPAPDADRPTLIRRAYFDLIGLPPSPEQVDAFVRDARPDAFARVVDELLASPHFGERWARRWLDVARFAESSGGGRTLLFKEAWRYRDYVIESFNRDVPFDTFIREQIAGDLLPHTDPAQRRRQLTATGFLALGPTNYEEQNKQALRMDIVDEQLDLIGKGFLGMTIGCARCHDHKFDPIPTHDYYALAGILRSTRTLENYTDNVAKWVDVALPTDATRAAEQAEHAAKIAALEAELKPLRAAVAATTPAASARASSAPTGPVRLESLRGLVIDETKARIVGDWQASTFGSAYIGDGYLHDRDEAKGAKTITFTPAIPRPGRYEVRLAYTPSANRASSVPISILHADGEKTLTIDQRAAPPIAGRWVSLGQFSFEKDGQGYILISNEGTTGHVVVDALQLLSADDLQREQVPAQPMVAVTAETRDATLKLRRLEADLKRLIAAGPKRELAMAVAEADDIGDTEIRIRGNVRSLGAKVPRGFLQVATTGPLPQFSSTASGRRELADWIASPANPLTARVAVNRAWTWLIGGGLVRTVDNFGTTGETPSHPALLDHLALQFIADGWSTKKLIRQIVLSRTYQLATAAPSAADPDNRFLTHAHRRRLDAEQLRDAILWTAGTLSLELGGPNIGQGPNGAANLPVNAEYTYVFSDTRRSLYTPAFRNQRLELFEVFDFADINAPTGQRNVSTVAPQALYLMNHRFVVEQARQAARRTLALHDRSESARVDEAYRLVLGRAPTARERTLAFRFLATADAPESAPLEPHEAWTQLYQALFASIDFRYLN